MNVIFTVIFLISSVVICIISPAEFLPALLGGAENALKCAFTLFCIYAVYMGLSAVAEDCKLTQKGAKLLAPLCKKIFKTDNQEAIKDISMNISCNLLGIGGAATPYGVKAIEALERDNNTFAQNMLFIINATSIQLIPTTVIALRAQAGSQAAYDITLPSLIATAVSTLVGAGSYALICKIAAARRSKKRTARTDKRKVRGKGAQCDT